MSDLVSKKLETTVKLPVINRKPIAPSLSLEQIVTGIEAAVKAIGENQEDIKTVEGQTH